jgi:hypothetical protein
MNTPLLPRTLTRTLLIVLALTVPLTLAACGGDDAAEEGMGDTQTMPPDRMDGQMPDQREGQMMDEMPMDDGIMEGGTMEGGMMEGGMMDDGARSRGSIQPRMEDGVQVVDINVGPGGYEPQEIRLRTGVPARLVFTRTTDQTCATQIKVPAFDIGPVDLPLGEPVAVELTPDEAGDFTFTCGMDMVSGSLMVQS